MTVRLMSQNTISQDAPVPQGKVLQVVQGQTSTAVSTTSTSLVDSGLTATITPSSATSKILVFVSQRMRTQTTGGGSNAYGVVLLRDSTTIWSAADFMAVVNSTTDRRESFDLVYLDSPASTSALTYKTQLDKNSFTTTLTAQADSHPSQIILMEIAA